MILGEKFFASHNIDYLTVGHDTNIAGDISTTILINHEWREWLVGLIEANRKSYLASLEEPQLAEIENWYDALVSDLYN